MSKIIANINYATKISSGSTLCVRTVHTQTRTYPVTLGDYMELAGGTGQGIKQRSWTRSDPLEQRTFQK